MLPLSSATRILQGLKPSGFATAGCLMPRRFMVRFSENGQYKPIYCDCGRCIKCCDNRREQMAARMFLHALDYKHVYFVTLTYGTYDLSKFEKHPFLADWLETFPILSTFNSSRMPRVMPTILNRVHLIKFLKRLRAKLPFDISYAAAGEYGSTYCRPHFHVILYSNEEITYKDVCESWSIECQRVNANDPICNGKDRRLFVRPFRGFPKWWLDSLPAKVDRSKLKKEDFPNFFRFRIGGVDMHDLVANGSLNYDGRHPGEVDISMFEGHDNFTYVAKYLGKSDPNTYLSNMPVQLRDRIDDAYLCLNGIYTVNTDVSKRVVDCISKQNKILFNNYPYDVSKFEFSKMVSPFFVSSRRPALGKTYFLQNSHRFEAENFALPDFMGKKVAFPSYFSRLLSQKRYPIRLRKIVCSGISPTKDLLPRLRDYLLGLRTDSNYYYYVRGIMPNAAGKWRRDSRFDLRECYCLTAKVDKESGAASDPNPFFGTLDQIDLYCVDDTVLHYSYDPFHEIFEGYSFDRHVREYVFREYIYKDDFIDWILEYIEAEIARLPDKLQHIDTVFNAQKLIFEDDDTQKEIEKYIATRKEMTIKHNLSTPKIF